MHQGGDVDHLHGQGRFLDGLGPGPSELGGQEHQARTHPLAGTGQNIVRQLRQKPPVGSGEPGQVLVQLRQEGHERPGAHSLPDGLEDLGDGGHGTTLWTQARRPLGKSPAHNVTAKVRARHPAKEGESATFPGRDGPTRNIRCTSPK